jgi:ABC-type transport system substrate-binding protein
MFSTLGVLSPDPGALPALMLGSQNAKPGGLNWANYAPKSVDNLLARGIASSKPSVRLAIYGQLLKKLGTDVPYVPLYESNSYAAVSSQITMPDTAYILYTVLAPWAMLVKPNR